MSKLATAFHKEMLTTYHEAARAGYRPTRFLQMVNEEGGVVTAHKLISTDGISEGLTRLWEIGRLDISLEALVLKPEYRTLFSDHERQVSRELLATMQYTAPWDKDDQDVSDRDDPKALEAQ